MTTILGVANNLPKAIVEIAKELRVSEEAVGSLVERICVDTERHRIPLMRVLDDMDQWGDLDEISDENVESLRKQVDNEITSSILSAEERADFARYEALIDKNDRQSAEALRSIRDRRLYREEFATWDNYCVVR